MGSSASRMCGTGSLGVVKLQKLKNEDPPSTPDTVSSTGEITYEDVLSCQTEILDSRQVVQIAATGGTEVTWSDIICRDKGIVFDQVVPPLNTAYVGLYPPKTKHDSKIIQHFDSISYSQTDDNEYDSDDVTSAESGGNSTPVDSDGKEIVTSLLDELIDTVIKECMDKEMSDVPNGDCDKDGGTDEDNLEALVDSLQFDLADAFLLTMEKTNRRNGLHDVFPTPKVLQTAQETWVATNTAIPRDDVGCPLPHPFMSPETIVECGIEAVMSSLKAKTLKIAASYDQGWQTLVKQANASLVPVSSGYPRLSRLFKAACSLHCEEHANLERVYPLAESQPLTEQRFALQNTSLSDRLLVPHVEQEILTRLEHLISPLVFMKDNVNLKDVLRHIQTSCADKEAVIRCVFSLVQVARRPELEDMTGQLIKGWVEENDLRVHVFNYVCRSMDIPTATISGYHKQDVSDGFEEKPPKTTLWSAVMLNDRWKYIDTTRRSVFKDEVHLWKVYRPSFCTSWLVSPLCFIQTHLPTKRHWQQLSRTVRREEWDNMVLLTPHFFHYSIQLHSHHKYEISCEGESVTVLLRYPERNQLLFEAKLLFHDTPVQVNLPKNSSSTYVETRICDQSELLIRVMPPHMGEFVLGIFGLDISEKPYKCMHLCSYKVQCTKHSGKNTFFPSGCQGRYQWGPGADTINSGLSPVNCFDSSIVCETTSLHLKFRVATACQCQNIMFTLKGDDRLKEHLDKHVFFWMADGLAHFLVHSPGPGQYVFNICERMRLSTVSVCLYLIDFTGQPSDITLPTVFTDSRLGTTKAGIDAGFDQTTWLSAYATAPATGEIVLLPVFDHDNVSNSFIHLKLLGKDSMDMTVYTRCHIEDSALSCTILLPRIGTYLLSLYVEMDDGSTSCWHNAIIIAEVPCTTWAPFPSRNHDVPINFCLHSPLSGLIPSKSEVAFSLQLNEAHDVAVVTSGGWFHLEKSSSNPSLWTGNVNTGARGTEMRLCARFESGSGTFTPLCVYKVISAEEYESRSSQQNTTRESILHGTQPKIS